MRARERKERVRAEWDLGHGSQNRQWQLGVSSVHGISPSKNTGVGSHSLLQGIFRTQGWNLGLLHRRQDLYH